MKGTPPLIAQRRNTLPATQWTAGLGKSLREAEVLTSKFQCGLPMEIRRTPSCVWFVFTVTKRVRLGLRGVFCPTGLQQVRMVRNSASQVSISAKGGLGDYVVNIATVEGSSSMIRLTTSLKPGEETRITAAPSDLCTLDARFNPYPGQGRLYTCQTGHTAGQTFFSALGRDGATVCYFQNFTALADYFRATNAQVMGCVSGEWPEAGFTLPKGETTLKPRKPYIIGDAFVEMRPSLMEKESDAALMFLEALARIYPLLEHPTFEFFDWRQQALKTMKTLTKGKECTRKVGGKLYLQAYVGSSYKPPEGMVQGALIVPLMEYAAWRRKVLPLLNQLGHVPRSFFDEKLQVPIRWLPGVEFTKEECSEEEVRFRMDSWYLLHTLMNLGRMAELGMQEARDVFLASMETLVRVARHFNYDWPVFYDQRDLTVFKQETQPGEGGEQDACGLYVHVMMQAYNLTHQQNFLDEAEAGAARLAGLGFGILYQTNNTVIGAVALARLWKVTGKTPYKEQSIISIASTFSHLWLWNLGKDTRTYMGLPPLHDAPYIAFYEEAEVLAALQTYQTVMQDSLPDAMALFIAEYHKHLLARGQHYFPDQLPEDLLTKEPKEGVLRENFAIPLEGLGGVGDKAGTVGQAVYAGAAPFILTSRCWVRNAIMPCQLFCSYPLFEVEHDGTRKSGSLQFRVGGVNTMNCHLKLFPENSSSTFALADEHKNRLPLAATTTLAGGTRYTLSWHH